MSTPARRGRSPGERAERVSVTAMCRWVTAPVAAVALLTVASCAPVARPPFPASGDWADSVLASLSPRDKAAQLVWPQVFGDYTPELTPAWERVVQLVTREHV